MVTRYAEAATVIPVKTKDYRAAVRTVCGEREAQITDCADTDTLCALITGTLPKTVNGDEKKKEVLDSEGASQDPKVYESFDPKQFEQVANPAPVESEEDDVVKLITTHSAKGLEFPVVIVADVDRDNIRPSDYFVYSRNHGLSFKILNPSTNEEERPLSYERINDESKEKELREEKRLLFVAMTRAQELVRM